MTRFLAYAPQSGSSIGTELGRSDYSYWFVLKYFEPLLASIGDVVILDSPDAPAPGGPGPDDVRLLFLPPHRIGPDLARGAIPVFAWEYDTIPSEPWGGEPANDWRVTFAAARGAITHSRYAADAVHRTMGQDYPVTSLPAPLWDRFAPLAQEPTPRVWQWHVSARVLDSWQAGLREGPVLDEAVPLPEPREQSLTFEGIVYTTVANPDDGRKRWQDTLTAFVTAHRDHPDATLIIKIVHFDALVGFGIVWHVLRRLGPFACRVVVVQGYLTDDAMETLITGSDFVVNSSRGEGQCLPLMEFMSAGVPAIAPAHTAMAEYVTAASGFPVGWTEEWTQWPHDARLVLRCLTYPPRWDQLVEAFQASYRIAREDPDAYLELSRGAQRAQHDYCSREVVGASLRRFLAELR